MRRDVDPKVLRGIHRLVKDFSPLRSIKGWN